MTRTCTFVPGLVERTVELHFSGVVKPIYEENPDPSGDHVMYCHLLHFLCCWYGSTAVTFFLVIA